MVNHVNRVLRKYQRSELKTKHNAVLPNETKNIPTFAAAGRLSDCIIISEIGNLVGRYGACSQMTEQESNRVRGTTSEKLCHLFAKLNYGEKSKSMLDTNDMT